MTTYRQKQTEVINQIEDQINTSSLKFSLVSPVVDYENDPRICLTSVCIPKENLKTKIAEIINVLKAIEPKYYYYDSDTFHITIKNVKVINNPPNFTEEDIKKAEKVFSDVIPKHFQYNVYFYRLLLFPNNLALIGTTDPELDSIFFDLDKKLKEKGLPDDKKYTNSRYFFCNMTLARFPNISDKFREKVNELSKSLELEPYKIDSVTLLTSNAVFKKRRIINSWKLK